MSTIASLGAKEETKNILDSGGFFKEGLNGGCRKPQRYFKPEVVVLAFGSFKMSLPLRS